MNVAGRRALLVGGGAAVAATLAVATRLGKPDAPTIHTPVEPPAPSAPPALLGIERLVTPGRPATPALALFVDGAGAEHSLADFLGTALVVNLWATWCMPCVAEMPSLAVLSGRLAGEGVTVMPLSSDRGGAEAVRAYYAAHKLVGLPVWLDPGGLAAKAWGVRGIPTTLIVDRAGHEVGRLEGGADWGSDAAHARIMALVG